MDTIPELGIHMESFTSKVTEVTDALKRHGAVLDSICAKSQEVARINRQEVERSQQERAEESKRLFEERAVRESEKTAHTEWMKQKEEQISLKGGEILQLESKTALLETRIGVLTHEHGKVSSQVTEILSHASTIERSVNGMKADELKLSKSIEDKKIEESSLVSSIQDKKQQFTRVSSDLATLEARLK